ncbi:hypothetical protein WCD74_04420 [Actinomycetospora sp. OC33-EN08]|uniref:Uncharacterized protein n=1 Tax=Actinomycetospora aurantiaca TaxID=3129233 RepID=A0ABU8MIH9_9PSEU
MSPRVVAHLVLAALPLLSITAHVAGLVPMHVSAGIVIVPAAAVLVLLAVFSPAPEDRLVLDGLRWGLIATAVYDVFRLDTVALLGWWDDFIPTMGTWLLDVDPSEQVLGGVAGYVWRYAGDGGGLGVVFVTLAAATGLRRLGPRWTVGAAVLFAVGPTWGGLMATVLLPRGQTLMFALTPVTVTLSFLGHVVFGLVLGLGTWRLRGIEERWSGPLLVDLPALLRRRTPVPDDEPVRALRPVPPVREPYDPYAADPLPLDPWRPAPFEDPAPTGEVAVLPWGSHRSSGRSPDVTARSAWSASR